MYLVRLYLGSLVHHVDAVPTAVGHGVAEPERHDNDRDDPEEAGRQADQTAKQLSGPQLPSRRLIAAALWSLRLDAPACPALSLLARSLDAIRLAPLTGVYFAWVEELRRNAEISIAGLSVRGTVGKNRASPRPATTLTSAS